MASIRGQGSHASASILKGCNLNAAAQPDSAVLSPAAHSRTRTERERHRSADNDAIADAREPVELTHPASQPAYSGFDLDYIARVNRVPITHPFDTHEEDQL